MGTFVLFTHRCQMSIEIANKFQCQAVPQKLCASCATFCYAMSWVFKMPLPFKLVNIRFYLRLVAQGIAYMYLHTGAHRSLQQQQQQQQHWIFHEIDEIRQFS